MNDLWETDPKRAARLAYLELQLVWSDQTQFSGMPCFEGIDCSDEDEDEDEETRVSAHNATLVAT